MLKIWQATVVSAQADSAAHDVLQPTKKEQWWWWWKRGEGRLAAAAAALSSRHLPHWRDNGQQGSRLGLDCPPQSASGKWSRLDSIVQAYFPAFRQCSLYSIAVLFQVSLSSQQKTGARAHFNCRSFGRLATWVTRATLPPTLHHRSLCWHGACLTVAAVLLYCVHISIA